MQLGRVIGSVWSTAKNTNLQGHRLLLVQPVNDRAEPFGKTIVCTDSTGAAGAGELVYWVRGREAAFSFLPETVVTDNSIVGIVDELHVERQAGSC